MSSLTFNKFAGALLATGLTILGLRALSGAVFSEEKVEKPGYAVAVAETAAEGAAEAETPPDWGTVLPAVDPAAGKAVFGKCQSCHTDAQGGPNGTGPNLYGVIGRKPAAVPGFAYSSAMTEFAAQHPAWDFEQLDAFLKDPQGHIPGTKMTFVGLKKQDERINMIGYLQSLGSSLSIPPPNPAASAEAAPAAGAEASAEAPAAEAAPAGAEAPAAAAAQ